MERKWLGYFAAIVFMFASCSKETSLKDNITINFSGKINNLQATTTTGASTNWLPNDQIGVYMVETGTNTLTASNSNKQYSYIGNQFSPIPGNEIYYPVNDSKVDFIAYYPYKVGYELEIPIVLNLEDQSDLTKLDFLYAKSNNGGRGFNKTAGISVPLSFDHKLSKIIIRPIAGQGMNSQDSLWSNMKVLVKGLNSRCNLELSTGNISSPNSPITINPFVRSAGVMYEAVTIPHQYTATGSVSIEFEIGNDIYVWNSTANETFQSGKEYTYTITVNKTGVVLGNVTINDWTSVHRSGNAI